MMLNIKFKALTSLYFVPLVRVLGMLSGLLWSMTPLHADYAAVIDDSSHGYHYDLSSNTTVSSQTEKGTDGDYYLIGNPFSLSEINGTGSGQCVGQTWGYLRPGDIPDTEFDASNVYHFLKMFIPKVAPSVSISGRTAYQLNSNVYVTVEAGNSYMMYTWSKTPLASVCARGGGRYYVYSLTSQFPIVLRFYLKNKTIDGQLVIPATPLAGYFRAFGNRTPSAVTTFEKSSAPIWLNYSRINFNATCTTSTSSSGSVGTLNLNHGALATTHYDSLVSGQVNYSCDFTKSTDVILRLNYTKDGDPQGRLPLINTLDNSKKIYTTLSMQDESSGQEVQAGTDLKVSIEKFKTITVKSHLRGENAEAGDYSGSAWLIATFD
ncbi:adhesin [Acinetobacter sp. S40]|uniref:hypothetical protein n=1 Tax=Acinetobacter sp. S40 TaxID=2767434 RepID=UPI00190C1E05|nr:hypothetical protein [Acinetobacter sp. S40]MBJ9983889.1 adhesin [Acinetobacter sp. S40]